MGEEGTTVYRQDEYLNTEVLSAADLSKQAIPTGNVDLNRVLKLRCWVQYCFFLNLVTPS